MLFHSLSMHLSLCQTTRETREERREEKDLHSHPEKINQFIHTVRSSEIDTILRPQEAFFAL